MIYSVKSIDVNNIPLNVMLENIPPRRELLPALCSHTLRISLITEGRGMWHIGERDYDIGKGDIFILNNSEYRKIYVVHPPDDLQMVILEFEPRLIWSNYGDHYDQQFLNAFFGRDESFSNRIKSGGNIALMVAGLISEIRQEVDGSLPKRHQVIKADLLKILALLNRHYHSNGIRETASGFAAKRHPSEINAVMEYIEAHLAEDLSLRQLAGKAHMNPSYFSRLFSRYNGLSLSQYIIRKRILKSVSLLKESDMNILEIAGLCGFNNLSNFYLAFRAVTNSTPTAYRNLMP